jgi:hypothetical protein
MLGNENPEYGVRVWLGKRLGLEAKAASNNLDNRNTRNNSYKFTCCIASTRSQVRSPWKPSEWLQLILVVRVLSITELIRLTRITGVTRVLSFSSNFSVDRAGLREAARVLGDVLWSSGIWCEFACSRTFRNLWLTAIPPIFRPSILLLVIITRASRTDLPK